MRFSIEIVAFVAALSFSTINAAPVPAPDANAEPHNFFRSRYGNGRGGYSSPHFISVGSWKRDAPAAEVEKRQEPYGAGYGYGYYDGRYYGSDRYREGGRHEDGRARESDPHAVHGGHEDVDHVLDKLNKGEDPRRRKGHKEKEHREKEHREKEHREKEHRVKDHREKGHREQEHKEKEIFVDREHEHRDRVPRGEGKKGITKASLMVSKGIKKALAYSSPKVMLYNALPSK